MPIDYSPANGADNLGYHAGSGVVGDEDSIVLIDIRRLFIECEQMFSGEIPEKTGIA